MTSDREALNRLCDENAQVSCHYFIDQQGVLYQLVADKNVAWHAGESQWGDVKSLNFHSLGIEISNAGPPENPPYKECQYHTLKKLVAELMETYEIPSQHVLAHSQIAPQRKDDPGEHFDWTWLQKKLP